MGWESRKKEETIEDFYLEVPEEKIYFPIDFIWKNKDGKPVELKNNWSVNLEEGKKKTIEISEINFKKNKLHGR